MDSTAQLLELLLKLQIPAVEEVPGPVDRLDLPCQKQWRTINLLYTMLYNTVIYRFTGRLL